MQIHIEGIATEHKNTGGVLEDSNGNTAILVATQAKEKEPSKVSDV
jgi:hypothetical protein